MSGGLFGNTNTASSSGGGLFGSTTNSSTGIFGSPSTNTGNNSSGGLFGNATGASTSSGGLFSSNKKTNSNTSNGLFGSGNATSTGGLFGSSTSTNNTTSGSLFGAKNQSTNSSSLFGNTGGSTNTGFGSGSLFGNTATNNAGNNNSTLFGNNQSGGFNQQQQQQQQQPQMNSMNQLSFVSPQQRAAEKLQLVNTFLPLILYSETSTLKFRATQTFAPSQNTQNNPAMGGNMNMMNNIQQCVMQGNLPDQMRTEILKLHLKINQTNKMLENLKKVTMPELEELDEVITQLAETLNNVKNELDTKEGIVAQLIEKAKVNAKLSEKVLHDTRRCNNNYSVTNLSSYNNLQSQQGGSNVRYILTKTIPSDFFVNLIGTLEKKLRETEASIDSLKAYAEVLKRGESEQEGEPNRKVELSKLLEQQYQYFLRVAGLIAKTNKQMNILREMYTTRFGDDFAAADKADQEAKEKQIRQIEQNSANVNLNEVYQAAKQQASNKPSTTTALSTTGTNSFNQTANQTNTSGGIFGTNSNANTPTTGGTGLFGSTSVATNNTNASATGSSSLFGSSVASSTPSSAATGTSLFGGATNSQPTSSGLFGNSSTTTGGQFGTSTTEDASAPKKNARNKRNTRRR